MVTEYNTLKYVNESAQNWKFANTIISVALSKKRLTWLDKLGSVSLCVLNNTPIYVLFPVSDEPYIKIITTEAGVNLIHKIRKGEKI